MKKEKSGTVYVLSIDLNKQKYYVMDLKGSLSRSIYDSMLFLYESIAESYAGPIEHLICRPNGHRKDAYSCISSSRSMGFFP